MTKEEIERSIRIKQFIYNSWDWLTVGTTCAIIRLSDTRTVRRE